MIFISFDFYLDPIKLVHDVDLFRRLDLTDINIGQLPSHLIDQTSYRNFSQPYVNEISGIL